MIKRLVLILLATIIALLIIPAAMAQDAAAEETTVEARPAIPAAYTMQNVRFEHQQWNNCGPATLTNALSHFGYTNDQGRAAQWLKPNGEDKNVSPWQMAEFVNAQVPELPVQALVRVGGDLEHLKQLVANDFPVIIEKGYDPEPDRLGWMGHYLLMIGYNDGAEQFITHDSYIGQNVEYSYSYIEDFWQHFNYTYLVLYNVTRYEELMSILGDDADERQNYVNALEIARAEAIEDAGDAFAWFNMGTNFVELGMYQEAAIAYDQARNIGLPWRMLWYQFGPFEAYYEVGRYDDMITLAQANMNDGGGHFVEETFYYGGLARQGRGESERAILNYNSALEFNPNFTPAREARDQLTSSLSNG